MKKVRMFFTAAALSAALLAAPAQAAGLTHTVVQGDTMWKLAVRYQVGTSETIQANPQIANPDLIYPGQIPNTQFHIITWDQYILYRLSY